VITDYCDITSPYALPSLEVELDNSIDRGTGVVAKKGPEDYHAHAQRPSRPVIAYWLGNSENDEKHRLKSSTYVKLQVTFTIFAASET